jgi:hypothetical protein
MDTTLVPCDEPQEPPKPKDQPKGNGGSAGAVEKGGVDERKGGAADYAEEDAEHKKYLFDWAEDVLTETGLIDELKAASNILELNRIRFDPNNAEVILRIHSALHPVSGKRNKHFVGMREPQLKTILANRFAQFQNEQRKELRKRRRPSE